MPVTAVNAIRKVLRSNPRTEAELEELATAAHALPTSEILYLMRTASPTQSAMLFLVLGKDRELEVFKELSPSYQAELIGTLQTDHLAGIVTDLDPDDRALLFHELPASVVERLMRGLSDEEQQMTASLLGYPKNSAGRHMSPEVLSLREGSTAGQALAEVRARIDEPETVYVLPVVAASRRLVGLTSLRSLLAAEPETPVSEIAQPPVSAQATEDFERTARRFRSERLLAMPIVDSEDRLLGILTIDDALAVIEHTDTRNAAYSGGSSPLPRPYLAMPILRMVRSRIVWLTVLALSAILTVQVLEIFEDRLAEVVVLALFIPLLTGTAGNTGNQAATTITRALALEEVRIRDLPRILGREFGVGLLLGTVLGTLGVLLAGWVYGFDIGLVIGLTLLAICPMAACVGGVMPLVAKKIGADPAVFSNPFISTFCDATGLIIYFLIATAVLGLG